MAKTEKILGTLFCVAIVILTLFSNKYQKEKQSMIDKYRYITVAKVYEIKPEKSFTAAGFYFYYNGSKYESWKSIDKSGSMYINKYYKVELSTEKPEYSNILFDQEVTDSIEIVKAGFKYHD